MSKTQTIHRTVVVENTSHLDTVSIDLAIQVDCSCPEPNSYITTEAR